MIINDTFYRIESDQGGGIMRLTFRGFWDGTTVARYLADIERVFAARPPDRPVRILIDVRDLVPLGARENAAIQSRLTEPGPKDRTAFVIGSAGLLKMQIGRIAAIRRPRFFVDEGEALAWLMEP